MQGSSFGFKVSGSTFRNGTREEEPEPALAVGVYGGAFAASVRDQNAFARDLERQASGTRDVSLARVRRTVAPGAIVGRLEVPRLGVSAVAREGADIETLRNAVGHVRNTAFPGERGNAAFAIPRQLLSALERHPQRRSHRRHDT